MTSLRALAGVVLGVVLAGCGLVSTSPPAATPTDFGGLASLLDPQGIVVTDVVSGDAGCTDPDLVPDGDRIRRARPRPGDARPDPSLRVPQQGGMGAPSGCDPGLRGVVRDRPQTFEQVEQSPYIVASQGPWGADFEAALRRALEQGAGTGG